MNILIIEDELQLSEVLTAALQQNRYKVDAVYDGHVGEEYALSGIYDAIILDIMLPGKNGLEVLRTIRAQDVSTPVLLLTAKAGIEDKVTGLDLGADDYLAKPFAVRELLARLRAMTRRKSEFTGDTLTVGGTTLNIGMHELSNGDKKLRLTMKEYQIMELLLHNSGQIIPRERFIEKIWGFDSDAEYNTVEVYVSFLRKKLCAIGSFLQIKAVRNVGYTLEVMDD